MSQFEQQDERTILDSEIEDITAYLLSMAHAYARRREATQKAWNALQSVPSHVERFQRNPELWEQEG